MVRENRVINMPIRVIGFLIGLFLFADVFANSQYPIQSAAFFYGDQPQFQKFRPYDVLVIDPRSHVNPKFFYSDQRLLAYVSLGEVERDNQHQIKKDWKIGFNPIWKTAILDQTNEAWRQYFLEKIIAPLWEQGYKGFFLDTLDSFKIAVRSQDQQQLQWNAIQKTIQLIRKRYPDSIIILNRGFELLPALHQDIDAVAAESLFSGWDQKNKRYVSVNEQDRNELLTQFKKTQEWKLPFIAIDYVNPSDVSEAKRVAGKIHALGMIPWVTDGLLKTDGVSHLTTIQRKVLVLYSEPKQSTLFEPPAFLLFAMPLEYLGFVPDFKSLNSPLPSLSTIKDYSAVVVWVETSKKIEQDRLFNWLVQLKQKKTPIIFMGGFGFSLTANHLAEFGLQAEPDAKLDFQHKVGVQLEDKNIVGFESKLYPNAEGFFPLKAINGKALLSLISNGKQQDAIAMMPWGAYALNPYVVLTLPNEELLWMIHPIRFLKRIFKQMNLASPDVTTENGRRLLFAHIDGDSFGSPFMGNYRRIAAEVIRDDILKQYPIPTTVSVISSEFSDNGLSSLRREHFKNIAKTIFDLPWVEPASHTFSHPFDWILVQKQPISGKYNLPIKNYHYSPEAEISGSIQYINENLTSPNKKAKVLLWSGYANPDALALAVTREYHFYNLNGGNTDINAEHPSWTHISALGLQKGDAFQVFAPIMNEIAYTNGWTHPYYGFQHVIETFKLTDQDYRFKPLDIYYHFYSGEKTAGLAALKRVYEWALKQEPFPIFASEYVQKVWDFNEANIAMIDDGIQIRSGQVKELRVPQAIGFPDLPRSQNVLGYKLIHGDWYIHLGAADKAIVYFSKKPSDAPFLLDANAKVISFERHGQSIQFKLVGNMEIDFRLANMQHCTVEREGVLLSGQSEGDGIEHYHIKEKDSHGLRINCQK